MGHRRTIRERGGPGWVGEQTARSSGEATHTAPEPLGRQLPSACATPGRGNGQLFAEIESWGRWECRAEGRLGGRGAPGQQPCPPWPCPRSLGLAV